MIVKCLKDCEGWWTEGESYPAKYAPLGSRLIINGDAPQGRKQNGSDFFTLSHGMCERRGANGYPLCAA